MACELWSLTFCLFGVSWVTPSSVLELLSYWEGHVDERSNGEIWNVVALCLMWCLGEKEILIALRGKTCT